MGKCLLFAAAIAALAASAYAQAGPRNLPDAEFRPVIEQWYSQFNVATRGDVKTIQERVVSADYETCSGFLPANAGVATSPSRLSAALPRQSPTLHSKSRKCWCLAIV